MYLWFISTAALTTTGALSSYADTPSSLLQLGTECSCLTEVINDTFGHEGPGDTMIPCKLI